MPYWYGDERCILEIVTGTAVWYHSGLPPAPIRWVLVRDPTGVRDPQAFLCTDLDATPVAILGCFVSRWSIETTFQESRVHLGVETQRQWVRPRHRPNNASDIWTLFAPNPLGGRSRDRCRPSPQIGRMVR
jgi:hypothetical protein